MNAPPPPLSPLRKAAIALKALRARNDSLERAQSAPIAIVGLACRLPAGGDTPEALWQALATGRTGSGPVPRERWDGDAFFDPEPGTPGKMYVRNSCFIEGVDQFDPLFFRISPREAIGIDPQQRLLLETVHQALEDAGIPPLSLAGSRTGVFLGISTNDYSALLSRTAHGSGSNAGAGAGNAASVASGRISYTFGLQGPSFAVDTACSSSLVTAHLAVQSLRNGESDVALVAGVNLMLTPDITINFCQGRMLSPDGLCKTFDAGADGYVRGEGCGVLVLKRLDEALAAGDHVRAVIAGSAINQDGRSAGLTAPNGKAQVAVIRAALTNARLSPSDIDFIEAHGTGTSLGDPIEMHALRSVFEGRDRPLGVGSIKTNIGHTEAAAGVSGLIKAVLMLQHQQVPCHPTFHRINPHIDLGRLDVEIAREQRSAALRHIGVSSFGFSGTNAHVVLSAHVADDGIASLDQRHDGQPKLLISAQSPAAVERLADEYRRLLESGRADFADLCHSAQRGRSLYKWWIAADSPEQLAKARPSNGKPPALPPQPGRRIALPKTPFDKSRYWIDGADAPLPSPAAPTATHHPLLGPGPAHPSTAGKKFSARLSLADPALSFLAGHIVGGTIVLPGAAIIDMALAANPGRDLVDIRFHAPLVLAETDATHTSFTIEGDDSFAFRALTGADAEPATLIASGRYAEPQPESLAGVSLGGGEGTSVDTDTFYTALANHGVSYGETFRRLSAIRSAGTLATASLSPMASPAHAIHPAVLDASLQLVAAAADASGHIRMVPASIGRVTFRHSPAENATVQVETRPDADHVEAEVRVADASGLAFAVSGIVFRPLPRQQDFGFHTVEWRHRPLTEGLLPPAAFPQSQDMVAHLLQRSEALARRSGVTQYADAEAGLDRAATAFAVRALGQLGMDFSPGTEGSIGALAESLGVADRHLRLFRHLLGFLQQDGVLSLEGRRWRVLCSPDDGIDVEELTRQAPRLAVEIGVMARCGSALAEVLTGARDPLTLLFPSEGSAGAGSFYTGSTYAQTVNELAGDAVRKLLESLEPDRPVRIVEIGAGTGATTRAVLQAMDERPCEYVFTDISPAFLSAATATFGRPGFRTLRLDIERDPSDQGLPRGSADIIIAANVLHATADIAESLKHARSLLAPHGMLILIESTQARRWVDIVFGLTEGWWRFRDTALRPSHPLLSSAKWEAALRSAGFDPGVAEGLEVILGRNTASPSQTRGTISVSGEDAENVGARLREAGFAVAERGPSRQLIHILPATPVTERDQIELFTGLCKLAAGWIASEPQPQLTIIARPGPGHGGVAGFVRSLRLEQPGLRPRLIVAERLTDTVLADAASSDGEDDVRHEAGRRLVARIVKENEGAQARFDGTWLITGGAGGLGRAIAGELARSGARRLILTGRRTPPDLPDFGVPTEFHAGDTADATFLRELIESVGPLSGVIHAAGLLANAPIEAQSGPTASRVLHAKIGGALALDAATRRQPVEHFILFSTAAGVIGAARQANHAFAGSFFGALAAGRRAEGLPALSLDWGVWREIGSAARLGFASHAEELGLGSIAPETGVKAFSAAIGLRKEAVLIVPGADFRKVASQFGGSSPPIFADYAGSTAPGPAMVPPPAEHHVNAPSSIRTTNPLQALSRIVADILHIETTIDINVPLHEYGLDSLVAVEIKNRAANELGLDIQVRDLIEGASVRDLAERLPVMPQQVTPRVAAGDRERFYRIIERLLGLSAPLDPAAPLYDYGLDSLVAVEIRNRVERELGVEMQVRDMIEGASAGALADKLWTKPLYAPPAHASRGESRRIVPDLANRHEPFPLTDIQQAYWLGRREDMALGNVGCYLYTEFDTDQIDIERLEAAWNRLVVRHDMLRVVIGADGTQRILENVPYYKFPLLDLTGNSESSCASQLDERRSTLARRMAAPEAWPLFDIRLTRHGELTRIHTGFDLIALDAASIHALRVEWAALYDDPDVELPPIGLSFRDVVLESIDRRQSDSFRRSLDYWKARATTLPEAPDLPRAEPAEPGRPSFRRHKIVMSAERAALLKAQCRSRNITLSSALAAAYADILAGWSRSAHFCITVTSFNRPLIHPDIIALLGDFTSTLLLEVDARGDRFAERAAALARRMADDLDHGEVSGVEVLRHASRLRSGQVRNVPVVFTSALGFKAAGPRNGSHSSGWDRLGTTVYNVSSTPQVWIDHQVSEEDGQLFCNWDVLEGMFPVGVVEAMVTAHKRLLDGLATGEAWQWTRQAIRRPVRRAPMLPAPEVGLLHEDFCRHAAETPDAIAIHSPDLCLTYAEVKRAASHLAKRLATLIGEPDAAKDRLVAIALDKGWRQTVAVLGILMAGAAYLPIDPAWPPERRKQLIDQSGAHLLDPGWIDEACAETSAVTVPRFDDTDRLAYVIYTSGSTGVPKGVMIEHRAAAATIAAVNARWNVGPSDRTLALSSISFDLSVYDIFGPLSAGGAIVVPPPLPQPDPAVWANRLLEGRVTIWNTAPALMALMAEHGLPAGHGLRLVMMSGDWVPVDTVHRLRQQAPKARLVALGGATEAAIWSNFHDITALDPDWHSIPYGTPLDGQNLHVVDRDFIDVPDWTIGDIEIAGCGLARGYLGDPERTAERFRTDARTGERRYRTGDIGRFRPYANGEKQRFTPIEFLGREDFQVKIQGHRIELGEIENVLETHPAIARAVATAFPTGNGRERVLAAFVVPAVAEVAAVDFAAAVRAAEQTARQLCQPVDDQQFEANAAFLNRQTAAAAAQAMKRLTASDTIPTSDALIAEHGVAPRYRPWLDRTLPLVADHAGTMSEVPSIRSLPAANPFGLGESELDMLDQVIASLPDLLTERRHSADIYLSAETSNVYGTLFDVPNRTIASAVESLAASQTLRILEVGGGLGTTLAVLAQTLPRLGVHYTFSDVSRTMLGLAQNRFGQPAWLSYELLDINHIPPIDAETYHVIIATSALHVAGDVEAALAGLRQRLKPGGVLVALEQTEFFPWYDLNMGLQSGFDSRTDLDRRPKHPLLSRDAWSDALSRAGFGSVSVISPEGSLTRRLGFDVILAHATKSPKQDPEVTPGSLQSWLGERLPRHMVPRHIALVERLPLSANGKVDRSALRLPDIALARESQHDNTSLTALVTALVASCLGTAVEDPEKTFFELGATSLSLVALQRQLAERLGRTIPLQVIFEEPTTANLVRLLSSGDAASSPVIRFAPRPASDRRPTLVMMPGIFALPFYLRDLAAALQADVDLVSISLPGLPASETPLDSIESQAEFVIANIRRLQPRGPYYIGGHSYGGTVAYEVARRLRNEGEGVPVVILGDTVRTRTDLAAFQTDAVAYTAMVKGLIALYGTAIGRDDSILADGPPREIYDRLAAELAERGIFGPIDLPADRMAAMFMANFRALGRYRPLPMPGDLDLLRTDGGFPAEFLDHEPGDSLEDPALGWSDLVEGQIAIHAIPGDHLSLMAPETLQATAAIIRRLMAAMSQPAGPASA